jgi:hypothetical protein
MSTCCYLSQFKPGGTLSPEPHHTLTLVPSTLPSTASSLAAALHSQTADAVLSGVTPTPHPEPLPPHPDTPMLMGGDFPPANTSSQATDTGSPWWPPFFDVKVSVFGILNMFCKHWFLSQDHLTKQVVEAQKAPNGCTFTWVKFTPQFHSYLICSVLCLIMETHVTPGSRPSSSLVKRVKKILFVYILKLLSEEPHIGFFAPPSDLHKTAKIKKQCEAWKKTWAACREKGKSTNSLELVSTPKVPASRKQPYIVSPNNKSSFFSSAKEELKILDFKAWKGMLTLAENEHMAVLTGVGSRFSGLPPGLGPDGDNTLG